MPIFDFNKMFMSSGTLTGLGKFGSAVLIRGTKPSGVGVLISIPGAAAGDSNAKLTPKLYVSADDSTYVLHSQYDDAPVSLDASESVDLIMPLVTKKKYAKLYFGITGATTSHSFGAVMAGIVTNTAFDWTREWTFDNY